MEYNNKVKKLVLFVSVLHNQTNYQLVCEGKDGQDNAFSGIVTDPIDFIADVSPVVDKYGLDFSDSLVVILTDASTVSAEYRQALDIVRSDMQDRVCILGESYSDVMRCYDYAWPVHQHCKVFFDLYLNAVRYLKTMSESMNKKSPNPLINEQLYAILSKGGKKVFTQQ